MFSFGISGFICFSCHFSLTVLAYLWKQSSVTHPARLIILGMGRGFLCLGYVGLVPLRVCWVEGVLVGSDEREPADRLRPPPNPEGLEWQAALCSPDASCILFRTLALFYGRGCECWGKTRLPDTQMMAEGWSVHCHKPWQSLILLVPPPFVPVLSVTLSGLLKGLGFPLCSPFPEAGSLLGAALLCLLHWGAPAFWLLGSC